MRDFNLLLLFLSSIFIFLPQSIVAERTIDEQITFELDSLKFLKYLDESDSSIKSFYKDFSQDKANNRITSCDTLFNADSLNIAVKEFYKPYGWGLLGGVAAGLLSVAGAGGVLIANEKVGCKTNDSLNIVAEKYSSILIKSEQKKIRFKYASYGVIIGILANTLFFYYKFKK